MAIKPDKPSPEWDEYPIDDSPLPVRVDPEPSPTSGTPYLIAGALVVLLLIAGIIALTNGGDDGDVTQRDRSSSSESTETESSQPAALPFVDESVESTGAEAAAAPVVRWPDEFGSEVDGEAYYSGCVPGSSDTLPSGVWFGYVTAIGDGTIDFDLACYYGIEIIEETERPFVENSNKATRTLALASDVDIFTFSNDEGPIGPVTAGDYAITGWVDGLAEAVVTVEDGQVVVIQHQPAAG
ncbi:MAG: hypothetical protein R2733_00230 [Acidimicrobiales bacterium]